MCAHALWRWEQAVAEGTGREAACNDDDAHLVLCNPPSNPLPKSRRPWINERTNIATLSLAYTVSRLTAITVCVHHAALWEGYESARGTITPTPHRQRRIIPSDYLRRVGKDPRPITVPASSSRAVPSAVVIANLTFSFPDIGTVPSRCQVLARDRRGAERVNSSLCLGEQGRVGRSGLCAEER